MAARSRAEIPKVTDTATASTGASTETTPLIPQAQGTNAGATCLSSSKAVGRKVPRHTPMGATSRIDRKSTRLNSSHGYISYAVFCLKKKKKKQILKTIIKKKQKN